MQRTAITKAEHLDLDVAGMGYVALQEHGGIAKGTLGQGLCAAHRLAQGLGAIDALHADAPATAAGLDQQRVAHGCRDGLQAVQRTRQQAFTAGQQGHTGSLGDGAGTHLVAHGFDGLGCRAHPGQPAVLHRLRKHRVLGQESIPRMQRVCAAAAGRGQQLVHIEVALPRGVAPQRHRLVGTGHMQRIAVDLGMHGHRGQAQGTRRADDAAGDLAAVGDQQLLHSARLS